MYIDIGKEGMLGKLLKKLDWQLITMVMLKGGLSFYREDDHI